MDLRAVCFVRAIFDDLKDVSMESDDDDDAGRVVCVGDGVEKKSWRSGEGERL